MSDATSTVQGITLTPNRDLGSYSGAQVAIEGVKHVIGKLLDIGEEKYIYELLDLASAPIGKVLKIYRDAYAVAKDRLMNEILKGNESWLPVCIYTVPGGFVSVQDKIESLTFIDPKTGKRMRWHIKVRFTPDGEIDMEKTKVFMTPDEPEEESSNVRLADAPLDELDEAFKRQGIGGSSLHKAVNLFQSRQFNEAYQILKPAHEADPTDQFCADLLVNCCMAMRKVNEALEVLTASLRADSSWTVGWLQLAKLYAFVGDFDSADKIMKDQVSRTPFNAEAYDAIWSDIERFRQQRKP